MCCTVQMCAKDLQKEKEMNSDCRQGPGDTGCCLRYGSVGRKAGSAATVALLSTLGALVAGIPRKNPYASFLHSSFVLDRSRSVVEIPSPDLPGGEFMGHPLDYGGNLDFARPLAETSGKLKVQSYEFSDGSDTERGHTRYGKPVVKGYETVYDAKVKNGKRYGPSKKGILPPTTTDLRNDIADALEDSEETASSDYRHTMARYDLPRVKPVEFPNPLNVFF